MIYRVVIVLILTAYLASGRLYENRFKDYMRTFNKKYNSNEIKFRKLIYENNLKAIQKHNAEYLKGKQSFQMGENIFTDMTYHEIVGNHTGRSARSPVNLQSRKKFNFNKKKQLPTAIDWRNSGLVTPVKNQGSCGSCWAFSVVGCLEGQFARKYGRLVSFSEQQLLDCNYNKKTGNWGCDGGLEEIAFNYVQSKGIESAASYPYRAVRRKCQYSSSKVEGKFNKYVVIPVSEDALKQAVAEKGPISIAFYVNNQFQMYKSGVFSTTNCPNDYNSLNHAMVLVGYGTDATTGLEYWLVKNSWGTSWGEQGYVKIRRNFNNMCGIATNGLYAIAL